MESQTKATLQIKNGPSFSGYSFGASNSTAGEAVFTTSLVGYTESITDPSYCGQILVFTQPLIGNYGVPSSTALDEFNLLKFFESPHPHIKGIVVSDYSQQYSHWTAIESLGEFCKRENITAIAGVDTREIVQYLREQGSSLARITIENDTSVEYINPMADLLVSKVSTKKPYFIKSLLHEPVANIALIDCGVKENIVRCLVSRGANVTVLPYDYDIQTIAKNFDGIFISNGPGDPKSCQVTINNLKKLLNDETLYSLPIFGICLGHQLLALAAGGTTKKMKYGNRAHNIPVMDLINGHCYITSQNHGYEVDIDSLSDSDWKPYFVNINDKSNEGMIHLTRPIFSTQFHPEAKGGPLDTSVLFDKYFNDIAKYIANKNSANDNSIVLKLNANLAKYNLIPTSLPNQRILA
ncbi:hypothetical protein TBLA_0D00820 [Henningerozyma blattae CBS 6284]|uniref:Carbamoyl phosphate synthase arginine-specific small chain n=1 Tax=Henningerozyma blattae (strain ATCC 34711 / CBS 6284 / DSM 70876 / NBRC 10599 / NRRL Y-10934 / UCD 77-7) TaxID=1071380 RepID=I2H2I8_HENB6|nr:hypothetical protein TBLA_0D00820 [Tetrapisispora blattae CBS 6284]CCH60590.1 hypothetical protein TBLA_0D00820 [Tetrapisispora blattae CBS 6284]